MEILLTQHLHPCHNSVNQRSPTENYPKPLCAPKGPISETSGLLFLVNKNS
jgi:hypothetical protein